MKENAIIVDLLIAAAPALIAFILNVAYTKRIVANEKTAQKIEKLIELIESTEKKAYRYYKLSGSHSSSEGLGFDINSDVGNIGRKLNTLKQSPKATLALGEKMIVYRQALTGGDFQSPSREAVDRSSPVLTKIRTATHELASALEGCG